MAVIVRVSEVSDTGDILMPRPRLYEGIQERLKLLIGETEQLLRELIGAADCRIRTDVPQRPAIWRDLAGTGRAPNVHT